jgi:hypothetical protein
MHEVRIEPALALGAWTVFCSCGNLVGFAPTLAEAEEIGDRHETQAEEVTAR